jgi:cytochrome c oxidase subunit 3
MGVWLFLASEAMFFGSLFSAYVLLRTGAASWADASRWSRASDMLMLTAVLAAVAICVSLARRRRSRLLLLSGAGAGGAFLVAKAAQYSSLFAAGWHPASDLAFATWLVLTGVHWLHVAGGVVASVWVAGAVGRLPAAHLEERTYALALYWLFVDFIWIAIVSAL